MKSRPHTKSPDRTRLHLLLTKPYVRLPRTHHASRAACAHPNKGQKATRPSKRTIRSPHPTERNAAKACMRWQAVSSIDRPSAAQYTRPKGVDDVVIGFPSSRNAMPGTGAWGVAALDFMSRLDVPLKKEVGRELVFRAEQRASARADMGCNISLTFCSIYLAFRRAGVVSCWLFGLACLEEVALAFPGAR